MISSLLAQGTFWLEPPASTSAQNHDLVFYALLYVMAFFFFLVVAIMLAFVVLYRRRKGQTVRRRPHAQHAAGNFLDRHPAGHRDRLLRRRPAVLRRSGSAAGGGRRGGRRGQPMAVQFQVSQRGRIERAVPPGRSAGGAEAHLQGRHPRPLYPGLPRAAQRRAGAEYGDLVQAHGAYRQGPRHRRGGVSITSSARSTAATAMPK